MSAPTFDDLTRALSEYGLNWMDLRGRLPAHPTKRYPKCDPGMFAGAVCHHSAGHSTASAISRIEGMTRYTIRDRECSDGTRGWPGCPYDLIVSPAGVVYLPWDLDVANYHAGYAARPGNENAEFLGVCFLGDFNGPDHDTGHEPTLEQTGTLVQLIHALRDLWPSWHQEENGGLWLHNDLGKAKCPGNTISGIVRGARE